MKPNNILRQTALAARTGVFAGLCMAASATGALGQTVQITLPSDLCTTNLGTPLGDSILAFIAESDNFSEHMWYAGRMCPQTFCPVDWDAPGAQAVLARMGNRSFFLDIIASLDEICSSVAEELRGYVLPPIETIGGDYFPPDEPIECNVEFQIEQ